MINPPIGVTLLITQFITSFLRPLNPQLGVLVGLVYDYKTGLGLVNEVGFDGLWNPYVHVVFGGPMFIGLSCGF